MSNESLTTYTLYSLTATGRLAITAIVKQVCRGDLRPDAFFGDAEHNKNNGREDMEIAPYYTHDKNPYVISFEDHWFAAAQITE